MTEQEACGQSLLEHLSDAHDKIDTLESELTVAVETAFRRGAVEWTKSNYPEIYKQLTQRNTL
jgi:hypothetical protein